MAESVMSCDSCNTTNVRSRIDILLTRRDLKSST